MEVELIPVLEIGCSNQGLDSPNVFPTWEHAVDWDGYAARSHAKAGFPAPLKPFAPGLFFYRATELDLGNLQKLVADHLEGYFNGEWSLEEVNTLWGGYLLRIDGTNALFPQCCGQLADIIYWEHIAKQSRSVYYHGHPSPVATFTAQEVIFRCAASSEEFIPNTASEIRIPKGALSAAYDEVLAELAVLAQRLAQVRHGLNLHIGDLTNLLIFRNMELPY